MGGRPTKFRQICRKVLLNKVRRNDGYCRIDPEFSEGNEWKRGNLIELETDENNNLLSKEVKGMKEEFRTRLDQIRTTLNAIEMEHNIRLDMCANNSNRTVMLSHLPQIRGDPELEECRLRNALLKEKLKHCKEYLNGYDAVLKNEDGKDCHEQDSFVRKLLLKTARRQMKRMRLNEAIESFFQLIVATNGQLCGEEMWMLFEVCQLKITQTFDFYQRVATVIKSMDCNNNSSYIFEELWTSMVEDLRTECSEMFDLTIKIKVEVAEPLEESCLVEKLKYLIAAKVCALWVEITSVDHDEFDDVKDLFFDSLNKCIDAFLTLRAGDLSNMKATEVLNDAIRDFHRFYPTVACSRRLKKAMDKIVIGSKQIAESQVIQMKKLT